MNEKIYVLVHLEETDLMFLAKCFDQPKITSLRTVLSNNAQISLTSIGREGNSINVSNTASC